MKALLALAAITALAPAADPPRPRITGVPHVAFYAKDPAASDRFYREFLGFQPADRFDSHRVYKINDRQFVEIYPEREAGSDRLRNIALETDDAEAMRRYLGSRGIQVPERATKNAAGNLSFEFKDPEGHTVEVVQRRTVRDTGNPAAGDRVAKRM